MFGDFLRLTRCFVIPPVPIARTAVECQNGGFLIVSTVVTNDVGPETAIVRNTSTTRCIPVERYDSVEEAEAGHPKWVEFAKTAVMATMLGYGESVSPADYALIPFKENPDEGEGSDCSAADSGS